MNEMTVRWTETRPHQPTIDAGQYDLQSPGGTALADPAGDHSDALDRITGEPPAVVVEVVAEHEIDSVRRAGK